MSEHDNFEQQLQQHMQQQQDAQKQDVDLSRQLRMARAKALEPKPHWLFGHPKLVSAAAACLVAAVSVPLWLNQTSVEAPLSQGDMELVSQLDMFEHDIEFYYWLEEVDDHSS